MDYLLDTSVLIDLLRKNPEAKKFISDHLQDKIYTSAICVAEVFEGVYREKPENIPVKKEILEKLLNKFYEVVPFDSNQAEIAGKLRATLSLKGSLIGDLDILIAAAAMARNAVLVSKNSKHFLKITGLQTITI